MVPAARYTRPQEAVFLLVLLSAAQVTKQSLPYQATLTVTFAAKHQLSREAQPLSDPEFRSLWTQQVQPRATPSRPSLLLQQQEPQQLLHPAGADWAGPQGLYSWAGAQAAAGLQGSLAGAGGQAGLRMRAVSDGWKVELLQVRPHCIFSVRSSCAGLELKPAGSVCSV